MKSLGPSSLEGGDRFPRVRDLSWRECVFPLGPVLFCSAARITSLCERSSDFYPGIQALLLSEGLRLLALILLKHEKGF